MSDKILNAFKKEQKKQEFKEKMDKKAQSVKRFCHDNKGLLIVATTVIASESIKLSKAMIKRRQLKKQEQLQEEYCYDRSLGHYWRLKRPLSNREWLEIDGQKKSGKRLADILSSMKVLK